ncbi:Zn(2)-C6 fungal-type domain-containing protein [Mycena sanguinolenta]|uniref:Zn(2)-C6 fungal-type domain-containing protein n=1 Tax=Mycena sanguinolenta TaxID=230812 RepID=A0A8H6YN92_9AGAR|nr:Zn(2)-C6 fungal-type domain-containing protein [Mycena sanguinolenta]
MDSVQPLIPQELEREIFEIAAELHPDAISNILLVAARVHEWIEPLRYRTFILTDPASSCPRLRVLQQAIESKPAQFIRDNVWHLFVEPDFLDALDTFIPFCTGVRSLVIFKPHTQMLSQLETARPQRLAVPIEFFGHTEESMPIDLGLPMFSSLTHLDIWEDIIAIAPSWSSLALLPVLTHLAFFGLSYDVGVTILGMCRKLQVIISMETEDSTEWLMLSATVDDWEPRFVGMVVTTENYASDWETGLRGGSDFWARADAFVAMRRRGEIEPKSRYWIEDRDGI